MTNDAKNFYNKINYSFPHIFGSAAVGYYAVGHEQEWHAAYARKEFETLILDLGYEVRRKPNVVQQFMRELATLSSLHEDPFSAAEALPENQREMYYIYNVEKRLLWRKGGLGHTNDQEDAALYHEAQAMDICAQGPDLSPILPIAASTLKKLRSARMRWKTEGRNPVSVQREPRKIPETVSEVIWHDDGKDLL
ncbi:hypothetical protein [uncultured Paraglaciecola sp.]|uniref:hypothetical protein n=1 Tax=uncultured Paraglaciecola sp. TaxID=1765024 RepID=UPI002630EBCA|nr:hypothetical protein [uncultured Paraglaciecola sp.]